MDLQDYVITALFFARGVKQNNLCLGQQLILLCSLFKQSKQNYHCTIKLALMQNVSNPYLNCASIGVLLFIVTIAYFWRLKQQFNNRMSFLRSKTPEEVPSHKVIIAIEPHQLFFKLTSTPQTGWRQVILKHENDAGFWGGLSKMFKKKIYYRLSHEKTEICNFVQTLFQNNKTQLFLYTGVQLQIAEFIFKQLGILKYFPDPFRLSYNGSNGSKMHAIEVDSQTNRVIIFTGSKASFEEEYSKYFLAMKKNDKKLRQVGRKLNRLVNMNEDIDELHNQLTLLKISVQSESEDCS